MRRLLVPLVLLAVACSSSLPSLPPREDDPDAAAEYYAAKRAGTDDPHRAYALARQSMRTMKMHATATDASGEKPFDRWTFLGPGNVGGRTRVLIIDPVEPNVMYTGGVSGGIWKSITAGARWEPIGDELANIAVNSLVMDPKDRRVLYAGTGEGYFREEQRGTGLPLRGNGVFVTRDAGASWSQLPSTANENFHWVNDLVISAHDSARLYAATRTGVWRSNDGGATWTRVLSTTVKGGCLDLAYRADGAGDYLFTSCGSFERATVYRAKNAEADAPWEAVLSENNMGRTTLAIAPSNPSIVYALAASNEPGAYHQGLLAVYRSTANGDAGSWTPRVTNRSSDYPSTLLLTNPIPAMQSICRSPGSQNQYVTMGWYCNTIAVDPLDPNRVWVGGVDLFRSDDGGATWGVGSYWWTDEDNPAYVHADQHAIAFHPRYDGASNKTMFVVGDGGVYRTLDARANTARGRDGMCSPLLTSLVWSRLNNNLGVTQFYHGAVFSDGRRFIAGAQDNGTNYGDLSNGTNAWERVFGGDGAYVAIDPSDETIVYASYQGARIVRSGPSPFFDFREKTAGLNDAFLFITPFALDPSQPRRVWTGGTHMWRSDNRAETWLQVSAILPGKVSAVAIAPGNSNRVIAGTNNGFIVRSESATTTNALTAWTTTQPREGFVSSLTFDPVDANIVFATYAGFGGQHVWRSTDGGATWAPLEGVLPDIPVHSLAIDPTRRDRLYLGTDLGVFVSLDGGKSWSVENTGFAPVVTELVTIAPGARGPAVYAFTHGRGAWRAELVPAGPRRRSVR